MVNKVTLIGRLGRDPEVRRLDSGATVAKLTIATTEKYKNQAGELVENTEWHNVVAWRYTAEYAEKYLKKGMLVYAEGKLTHRKYTTPEGVDKYFTEVVANQLNILSRPNENGGGGGGGYFPNEEPATAKKAAASAPVAAATPATTSPAADAPAAEGDDLPF